MIFILIGLGLQGMKPIKESSEVQSIQIGDGDVMKNIPLPIYMIFPKWYVDNAQFYKYLH